MYLTSLVGMFFIYLKSDKWRQWTHLTFPHNSSEETLALEEFPNYGEAYIRNIYGGWRQQRRKER